MVKDRAAWHIAVYGVTKSQAQLSDWTTQSKIENRKTQQNQKLVLWKDTYIWENFRLS